MFKDSIKSNYQPLEEGPFSSSKNPCPSCLSSRWRFLENHSPREKLILTTYFFFIVAIMVGEIFFREPLYNLDVALIPGL
jgi:hypothetical protein